MSTSEILNALPAGMRIGEFRIVSVIGAGGFGIVYRAVDETLGATVAIKEYLPSDVAVRVGKSSVRARVTAEQSDFDWGLERFLDEARMLARFHHPNIVGVRRYLEANNTAYMVMPFVEGESLRALMTRRGPLPEKEVLALLDPLLDGLALVHRSGALHRDIKPGNIYIQSDGSPMLLDFGAARQAMGERSRSMTTILTPPYAPFEQYGQSRAQGPWTDLYALGAVAYEAISGRKIPSATDRIGSDPLRALSKVAPGPVSPAVDRALGAVLQVDAESRPQSVEDWRRLLWPPPGSATPGVAPVPRPQRGIPRPLIALTALLMLIPGLLVLCGNYPGPIVLGVDTAVPVGLVLMSYGWKVIGSLGLMSRAVYPGPGRAVLSCLGSVIVALAVFVLVGTGSALAFENGPFGAVGLTRPVGLAGIAAPFAFNFLWDWWDDRPSGRWLPVVVAIVVLAVLSPRTVTTLQSTLAVYDQVMVRAEEARGRAMAAATGARAAQTAARRSGSGGYGVVSYPSGGKYEGQLADRLKSGYGVYEMRNGDRYEGQFVQDLFEGDGLYQWRDAQVYMGGWRHEEENGFAVVLYPDGSRFYGRHADNRRDGKGVRVEAGGTIQAGLWKEGTFLRPFNADDRE